MKGKLQKTVRNLCSLLLLSAVLLTACGGATGTGRSGKQGDTPVSGSAVSGSAVSSSAVSSSAISGAVAAENKKYNLSLPTAENFGTELKDFIYWEYATMIEKDTQGLMSVLTTLEDMNCLNKELKLHLYYYECDISEMDYWNSNYYDVVVTFPEEKQLSWYSFPYTAKGFSTDYDYGTSGWFDDENDEDMEDESSSQKLEQKKWFQKQYTFFGETSLILTRKEAENYEVTNRFEKGKKEQILSQIEKAIKKYYKNSKNTVVCVRDFLPGDFSISGEVIDLNMTSKNSMPLFWIRSMLFYKDKKMEKFDDVYWDTHYSTRYSGTGTPDYNPTVEQLKKWAKEEKDGVNIEKCILAYQIKNGKIIDLKK